MLQIVVFLHQHCNIKKQKIIPKYNIIISPFQGLYYSGDGDGGYKRFTLSGLECVLVIAHLAIYV